jgi:hypothetical protein
LSGTFAPFAFHPDGQVLVAHADAWRVVALDVATGQILWTTPRLPGEWGQRIDFSRDGSTIFVTRLDDARGRAGVAGLLQLDAATGRQRGEPIRGRWPMVVAPDGKMLATVRVKDGQAYIDVHDLPAGRRTFSCPTGKSDVYELRYSPDQKSLFGVVIEGDAFSSDSYFGQSWSTETGRRNGPLMPRTRGGIYAASADRLLTLTDNLMVSRDTVTGRLRGAGFPVEGTFASSYLLA